MISSIKNFYKKYGIYYLKIWMWHLIAIVCLLTQDIVLAWYAFLIFLFINPLMQLIAHDYIAHEYCVPRKGFKFFALGLWYIFGQTIQGKKNYHIWHHLNYSKDTDPTHALLKDKSLIRYLFSLHQPQIQNIGIVSKGTITNDPIIKFLDKFAIHIYFLSIIILFISLPVSWFIIIRIYVPFYINLTSKFHDWYFHGAGPAKDTNWLFPIYASASWHIDHHITWNKEFHGNGFIKFINLQWWYRNLLFKTR